MKDFKNIKIEKIEMEETDVITTSSTVFSQTDGVYLENGQFSSLKDLSKE